jgi:hypothetical protein
MLLLHTFLAGFTTAVLFFFYWDRHQLPSSTFTDQIVIVRFPSPAQAMTTKGGVDSFASQGGARQIIIAFKYLNQRG